MANLSSALNVSFLGYGITGLNVSLAYFDLIYALLGIVVVINTIKLRHSISMKSEKSELQTVDAIV
jgi:hypothetical protein